MQCRVKRSYPSLRNGFEAVLCTRQTASNRTHGVGVTAEVYCFDKGLFKGRLLHRQHDRMQRINNVAGGRPIGWNFGHRPAIVTRNEFQQPSLIAPGYLATHISTHKH